MRKEEDRQKRDKEPIRFNIDLDTGERHLSEIEIIAQALKVEGLLGEQFLYSVFPVALEKTLLETGTYRIKNDKPQNMIFCCSYQRDENGNETIIDPSGSFDRDLTDYMTIGIGSEDRQNFAVFDREHLKSKPEDLYPSRFWFKDPDNRRAALVAIITVTGW